MNENLGYSAGGAISAEGAVTPFHGCAATWGARHDVSLPITPKILHMLRIRKMHSIHISQPIHIIEAVAAVIFMVSIHVVQVKTGRRIIGQSVLVLIIRIYGVYQHIKSLLSGFSVRMPVKRPFYSLRPAVSGMIPVILAVIDIT